MYDKIDCFNKDKAVAHLAKCAGVDKAMLAQKFGEAGRKAATLMTRSRSGAPIEICVEGCGSYVGEPLTLKGSFASDGENMVITNLRLDAGFCVFLA